MNLIYTGPVYFTANFQGLKERSNSRFIYDTGSGDLTTTSTFCNFGCRTQYYDQDKSLTAVQVTENISTLRYGSATLQGFYVEDTVCVAPVSDLCVDNFKFFEITAASGFAFDGILGMSPYGDGSSDSIVRALAQKGTIQEETATFCLH